MSTSESLQSKAAAGPVAEGLADLLRSRQWVKNAFVGAPLFFTPAALSLSTVITICGGIASFCMISSAVYVLNDYADREADRTHPTKCRRPLAAGTVPHGAAFGLFLVLLAGGFGLAYLLSPAFAGICAIYLACNVAYSLFLKRISIVDIMVIALCFILRVEAGAALIEVAPSAWIMIMTGLLALFLGLAKRRDDLAKNLGGEHRRSLDGYSLQYLDTAKAIVTAALLVAYLIYTTDQAVMARMGSTNLYCTAPFVVFGILRYLQIAQVEERSGSPTTIVLTDRLLIATILGWLVTFGALIYG